MSANHDQAIQLEYLSKIDRQQTNELLDSITVEEIEALYNQPFDGDLYCKFLKLPAINDPHGLTGMIMCLSEEMHSPMEIFEAQLEKNCQLLGGHILMAAIMLDKGSKGIVKTPEQEQEFIKIINQIKELDVKAQKLYLINDVFIKKYLGLGLGMMDIQRSFVFALDALFMHSGSFVEDMDEFEQNLPDWWKINKISIESKPYLSAAQSMCAGALYMDYHIGDAIKDFYVERFGEFNPVFSFSAKEKFTRNVGGLHNFQVCPDVLNLFHNLRKHLGAKPSSANKKAHKELIAQIKEANIVEFYSLNFK